MGAWYNKHFTHGLLEEMSKMVRIKIKGKSGMSYDGLEYKEPEDL